VHSALVVDDVVDRGLEQVGGDRLRLVADPLDRAQQRRAADRQAARAEGADAVLDDAGVAVEDGHVLHRNAELVLDDLGEGRLLTLAMRRDAGEHGDLAARVEANRRRVPADATHRRRRAHAADLDVAGETDTEQLLALLAHAGLLGAELLVPGHLEGQVERRLVIP
jgi:hypothetical protein